MPSVPEWGLTALAVLGPLIAVLLFLFRAYRARLGKIDDRLLELSKQVSYITGRLDERRSQEYKDLAEMLDRKRY